MVTRCGLLVAVASVINHALNADGHRPTVAPGNLVLHPRPPVVLRVTPLQLPRRRLPCVCRRLVNERQPFNGRLALSTFYSFKKRTKDATLRLLARVHPAPERLITDAAITRRKLIGRANLNGLHDARLTLWR